MTDDPDALVVLGDSVPAGNATDAAPWPDRLTEADDAVDEAGDALTEAGDALTEAGDALTESDDTLADTDSSLTETDSPLAGLPAVVRGDTGTTLASLADDTEAHLDAALEELSTLAALSTADPRVVVLVHAGHNDAQLSGGEPRVPETAFRHAATLLDRALADHPAVARHGFVGLVPLLPGHRVPFADAQPARSLTYDDALADSVATHYPVARPVGDWHDRTADGVHPEAAGHAAVARTVAERLG